MPSDGATGSWWNKAWPRGADGPKAAVNDPVFTEVVSDFSRQLAERSVDDPTTAARRRREALRAYDRAHRHRQILIGGFAVGALMGTALALIAPPVAPPHLAPTASAAASGPEPVMAAVAPAASVAPAPPVPISPAVEPPPPLAATVPVDTPPKTEPAATSPPPALAEPSPPATLLRAAEVREVQNKLRGFGFNPGPPDGVPGRMTLAAATQYQQQRGLPQTGQLDRELLDQLRQDPAPQVAPQVAQRPPRQPVRAGTMTARRETDPFQRLGQWLDSLVR